MSAPIDIYEELLEDARTKVAMLPGIARLGKGVQRVFNRNPAKGALAEMGVTREMLKNFKGSPDEFLGALEASSSQMVAQGASKEVAMQAAIATAKRDASLAGKGGLGAQYDVLKTHRAAQRANDPLLQNAQAMQQRADAQIASAAAAKPAPVAAPAAAPAPKGMSGVKSIGAGIAGAGIAGAGGYAAGKHVEQQNSQQQKQRAFRAGLSAAGPTQPPRPGGLNVQP